MATVAVIGANRGIGLEFCAQLRGRGDHVIAVCRHSSPELDALGARIEKDVEVTDDASVQTLSQRLVGIGIDILILNAGVLLRDSLDTLNMHDVQQQLEVNALGPLRAVRALLSNLQRGSKIIFVTSRMGSIGDNTSGGYYGYRMSKAALNMAGVSLAYDLKNRGIAVGIVHPGFVRTDMTGGQGDVDPPKSVRGMLERIDSLTLQTSGGFWHANGEKLPW